MLEDGRTHLAYKPEHAVDTGAVVAAESHAADRGDTTTMPETLQVAQADLAEVDAAPTPDDLAERVADKGCHTRCGSKEMVDGPWKSRIAQKKVPGVSRWHGDVAARPAVDDDRVRLQSGVARFKLRAELCERSFVSPWIAVGCVAPGEMVGAGNLNRCLYLRPGDEGARKARLLDERAAPDLPGLDLRPSEIEFADFMRGRRLPIETMIVTVDSRGARRKLQKFIPRRVLDASTTDMREVVFHSNEQPADGACLACLYRHTPNEEARTLSIAEGMDIEVASVGGFRKWRNRMADRGAPTHYRARLD